MNTDNMDAKETKEGHLIVNNAEGALVSQVRVHALPQAHI